MFLKYENHIQGRYFAELLKSVIHNVERNQYICTELRISLYGRHPNELLTLAQWFARYQMASPNILWVLQIPRIFAQYKEAGLVQNFEEQLHNIFGAMFAATLQPDLHPEIAELLSNVVAFDSCDDESKPDVVLSYANVRAVSADRWEAAEDPPYTYCVYYIYANLYMLNMLRRARGLNTLAFRPHCGDTGHQDHLGAAFLTAHSIN